VLELVLAARPQQCTLVPVRPGELTSDHGYTAEDVPRLRPTIERLHAAGIRVSLFVDCEPAHVRALAASGADRVELYTGPYALAWDTPAQAARSGEVQRSAEAARAVGLGLNAGHDLDRHNLRGLAGLTGLCEVSIGHAQICRALEVGTAQSVRELLTALGHG
jgi:pyridoxine 5-phosphate synthase